MESRLWPVPLTTVIAAVLLGIILPRLDAAVDAHLPAGVDAAVFAGGADTARSVLSSIAGSLITATSLTFSLTVVALQLASSQASPRVLRLFARDRQVHWTLAAFLGTFAYSLTVLRSVRSADDDIVEVVPRISVTLAFVLTLVSVLVLVFFLAHLAAQLRVETMLKDIHSETDRTISLIGERNAAVREYEGAVAEPATAETVTCDSSGFLTAHDHGALVRVGVTHGIVIRELRPVGENVVAGTPLARWWPEHAGVDAIDREAVAGAIRSAYSVGYERTAAEDVGFGMEQIVDIGLRALSSGVNDPTTAVHALGHVAALLVDFARMPRLPAAIAGEGGELRVVPVRRTAADDVEEALSSIRRYGAGDAVLVQRFVRLADELSVCAADADIDRVLTAQLEALSSQLKANDADPVTRDALIEATGAAALRIGGSGSADGR